MMHRTMTAAVRFGNVSRYFGEVRAVDHVNLTIASGEFFAMLGPSGFREDNLSAANCRRGFEQPTDGKIEIFGESAGGAALPAQRQHGLSGLCAVSASQHSRQCGLWVDARAPERPNDTVPPRTCWNWSSCPVMAHGPSQFSGGQRQRVALARSVVKPKAASMSRFGALDLKLREQMQEELKSLQKALGITFVFVTHDQGEALSMADRIAVQQRSYRSYGFTGNI